MRTTKIANFVALNHQSLNRSRDRDMKPYLCTWSLFYLWRLYFVTFLKWSNWEFYSLWFFTIADPAILCKLKFQAHWAPYLHSWMDQFTVFLEQIVNLSTCSNCTTRPRKRGITFPIHNLELVSCSRVTFSEDLLVSKNLFPPVRVAQWGDHEEDFNYYWQLSK